MFFARGAGRCGAAAARNMQAQPPSRRVPTLSELPSLIAHILEVADADNQALSARSNRRLNTLHKAAAQEAVTGLRMLLCAERERGSLRETAMSQVLESAICRSLAPLRAFCYGRLPLALSDSPLLSCCCLCVLLLPCLTHLYLAVAASEYYWCCLGRCLPFLWCCLCHCCSLCC